MTDPTGFKTPILLLVYKRPDTTRQVFASLRDLRPSSLYVAADGPRKDSPEDAVNCAEVRRLATQIDWECDLHTLFRDRNLGCGPGVSSAITWFFDNVEEGIILEDDCVPSRSFYTYCEQLLEYYREDRQVMHIGGDNFQYGRVRGGASYYFSRFPHAWGWASWRRAWRSFDFSLGPEELRRDVWDAQWMRSIERAGGVAIVPNINLVRNVGFGSAATHTTKPERYADLPAGEMTFPLTHPVSRAVDLEADRFTYYVHFRNVSHPKWIWAYRLSDYARNSVKFIKRKMRTGAR